VYTITVGCSDGGTETLMPGESNTATLKVTVPHDQGNYEPRS